MQWTKKQNNSKNNYIRIFCPLKECRKKNDKNK